MLWFRTNWQVTFAIPWLEVEETLSKPSMPMEASPSTALPLMVRSLLGRRPLGQEPEAGEALKRSQSRRLRRLIDIGTGSDAGR